MPTHAPEVLYEKRVAVIIMRHFFDLTFAAIAEKLDLNPYTIQKIHNRAVKCTEEGLQDSFLDLTRNTKDTPRLSRLIIVFKKLETL